MSAICEVAEENGRKVALCAPTGKAAKKLSNATGREASTIHRLLEPIFDEETGGFRFRRHRGNPIEAELIVVDEVSMVDVHLMRSLLDAIDDGSRVLMVGDHHQIPSVGAGAILRDILSAANRFPGAIHVLTQVVRQAGQLARNTTAILDGVVATAQSPAWGLQTVTRGNERGAAGLVAGFVEALLTHPSPEPFGRPLDPAWDIQVLAPMRKGPLGTYALNRELQALRQRMLGNPPPEPSKRDDLPPKPLQGDRVIWTRNDYELRLFNGTQAVVKAVKKGGVLDIITEDGREITISSSQRQNLQVAYAITIHKAQGSEWPCVILAISSTHYIMRDRNLLYTGASRAATSLTIFGDLPGINAFAKSKQSLGRQTFGAFFVQGWEPTAA